MLSFLNTFNNTFNNTQNMDILYSSYNFYESLYYLYTVFSHIISVWFFELLFVLKEIKQTISLWFFELLVRCEQINISEWFSDVKQIIVYSIKFVNYDTLHFALMLYTFLYITYMLYNFPNPTKNNINYIEVDINPFISLDNKRLAYIEKLQSKIVFLEKKVDKLKHLINDLENGNIRRSERIRNNRINKN